MPLTFTIADAATDPPAATVSWAGPAGNFVSFFYAPLSDPSAWEDWFSAVFSTPPVTYPLAKGGWWVYANDSAHVPTPPRFVLVTDGTASLPTRCRAALAARFAVVGLTDPATGKILPVVEQIDPDETGIETLPAVLLTLVGQAEQERDTKRDDWDMVGYPTRVSIVASEGTPPDHRNLPTYEHWRYRLIQSVRNQGLDGVPEVSRCVVEPLPVVDHQFPRLQHLVSEFVVRCVAAAPRGLGA